MRMELQHLPMLGDLGKQPFDTREAKRDEKNNRKSKTPIRNQLQIVGM